MKTLIASTLMLCVTLPAQSAIYMKLDGIDGESQARDYLDYTVLTDVNWGISVATTNTGSGRVTSQAVFDDLSWSQTQDKSYVGMFQAIALGQVIATAEVAFVANIGGTPQEYFKMEFGNIRLTQLNLSGSSQGLPFITGAFDYETIDMEYQSYNPDGSMGGTEQASYDVRTGTGNLAALGNLYAQALVGPSVSAVPVPAAAWLFGSALLGMVGLGRHRLR